MEEPDKIRVMSLQIIKNVKISGIAAAVPARRLSSNQWTCFDSPEDCARYVENVGVEEVRTNDGSLTCADLCQGAAERLLRDLSWAAEEIDLLVFLSQSPDYPLPATACVLHGKMKMRQECTCFDISLGCSGWTYGLSIVAGMMQTGSFKKALLLVGDIHPDSEDHRKYVKPLFGNAGTATALQYDTNASDITIDTRTDGESYEAIIRRVGAYREPFTPDSLKYKADQHGQIHRPIDTEMDGPAVFIFGITKVPKAVKNILNVGHKTVDDIDAFFFHQANLMMNEQIRKKCKIPAEKCPYSLQKYGNNSSASIPLTMVTASRDLLHLSSREIVACAFGVGLSWGTLHTKLDCPVISELVEI